MLQRSDPMPATASGGSPAVFMDKDGTLIENVPYNVDVSLMQWMPGAEAAIRALVAAGFRLVVISNQSGVAEGRFPESALVAVESRLREMAAAAGVDLTGFFYCPHGTTEPGCDCRKPMPGLITRAAHEHRLDLGASWFVGDILSDVEAGNRAGCRSILVGPEALPMPCPKTCAPFALCDDLSDAARVILQSKATPT